MFPSEAYKELCTQPEVADRLREEWEPKVGDCIRYPLYEDFRLEPVGWEIGYICAVDYSLKITVYQGLYGSAEDWHWWAKKDVIPLFQPRQLIRMLEERRYALAHLGDERCEPDFEGRKWNPEEPYMALAQKEPGDYVRGTGPDPETALLRAWLEVVEQGD